MRKAIEQEKEDGCIAEWLGTKLYVEESLEENSFRAYLKNEYCFNHFNIYVSDVELSLSEPFIKEMLPTCLGMKYREDIAEQIEFWDIPEAVKRTAINDPSLYIRMQSALSGKYYLLLGCNFVDLLANRCYNKRECWQQTNESKNGYISNYFFRAQRGLEYA